MALGWILGGLVGGALLSGNKVKKKDYEASEGEKASASVAKAEYDYFKEKYDPLLQQMRDQSKTEDTSNILRGRANADTMQALTSQPSYQSTQNVTKTGDTAQALQGQLGIADKSAKQIQNTMQSNVLGTARGQAADAQTGMAQASRLGTSQALSRAKAKQTVAMAKHSAAAQIAGTFLAQGLDNMSTTGTVPGSGGEMGAGGVGPPTPPTQVQGTFMTPVNQQGQKISSFGDRLAHSQYFGPK